MGKGSIAEQFFQLRARGGFAGIGFRFWRPNTPGKFKILAKIAGGFFQHRLRAALTALVRDVNVVTRAVQTHAQIRAAFHARFAAPRIARKRPRLAAIMAMTRHSHLRLAIYDLRFPPQMQSMKINESVLRQIFAPAVIVGALGYFVDIYDLILFSIVRTASLKDLGFSGDDLVSHGIFLLNLQMVGMLVGGIVFGILGDRLGRVALLFSSILLYSIANIANGFVHSLEAYAAWRFIAGFGLAGELGGGITLVTEVLPKELRGYGTMIVATVGVFGAVIGGLVADLVHWRNAYFIGGGLGLLLLILRMSVAESGMFKNLKKSDTPVSRGNFLALFTNAKRFRKYLCCILIGLPTWFVIGILVTFSPEFAKALIV
jgi:hypothetical protein